MSYHSDVITYCWTELDRLAVLSPFPPGKYVTPYRILPSSIPNGSDLCDGDYLEISLSKSVDPATISRFFREPYEWIPLPDGVDPGSTMKDLFDALYAFDKVRFAHMDFKGAALAEGVGLVKNLLSSKPKMPGIDDVTPLADLASLHFEYWGNTDLRAAVFRGTMTDKTVDVLGVVGLTIPWFGSDPLSMPLALLEPIMAPTVKDDVTIQYVLALRPAQGVLVQAPPSRKETDLPIVVMSLTPPKIELDGWDRQVIAPFDLGTNVKSGDNQLNFKITLPRSSLKTRIEILKKDQVYYSEEHEGGEWLLPISHSWSWNGYSNEGVYSTTDLWSNDLTARVMVTDLEGRVTSATTALGSGRDKIRWVDVTVDRKTKTATVQVFAHFMNPSDVDLATLSMNIPQVLGGLLPGLPGVPSLPSIPTMPSVPGLSPGDEVKKAITIPDSFNLEQGDFNSFKKGFVVDSIARHWSRCKNPPTLTGEPSLDSLAPIARSIFIDDEPWELYVSCGERSKDAFPMILAKDVHDGLVGANLPDIMSEKEGGRSCNLACFMEGLPIIDVDSTEARPDVGAHELGHSVLRETKGVWISLTHKGTTTPGQQAIQPGDDHGGIQNVLDKGMGIFGSPSPQYQHASAYKFPDEITADEEFDVMLYWVKKSRHEMDADGKPLYRTNKQGQRLPKMETSDKSSTFLEHTFATKEDALGLIWLGKTAFG